IYYRTFKKSSLIHSVAPPFQIEPAAPGFDLVLGADLKAAASILLRCRTPSRTAYRSRRLFILKSHRSFIPSLLLSKSNPLRRASIWFWIRKPKPETETAFFCLSEKTSPKLKSKGSPKLFTAPRRLSGKKRRAILFAES
ncbi:MAG: hypothetical protein PUA83_07780, partial [Clostridiales bacterium]|nr:hypothetical protein [Clostridiales bacterium]